MKNPRITPAGIKHPMRKTARPSFAKVLALTQQAAAISGAARSQLSHSNNIMETYMATRKTDEIHTPVSCFKNKKYLQSLKPVIWIN